MQRVLNADAHDSHQRQLCKGSRVQYANAFLDSGEACSAGFNLAGEATIEDQLKPEPTAIFSPEGGEDSGTF
jgi:hypothetical protein